MLTVAKDPLGAESQRHARLVVYTQLILSRENCFNISLSNYRICDRSIVDSMAKALQASVLLRYSDAATAEGYINSRLAASSSSSFAHSYGSNYGSFVHPSNVCQQIIEKNMVICS